MAGMDEVFEYYPRAGAAQRYISAARLYGVLRGKLGCTEMGWRERGSWYWITPNGVPFPVNDPLADPDCVTMAARSGKRQLCFPYPYARELLERVRAISAMRAPPRLGRAAEARASS